MFRDVQIAAGQTWEGTGDLYVGPKEWDRLSALGVGLEAAQARNYGHFLWVLFPMWWFCVPLLWLMNFFGTWLPGQNYGVAIILLTVLVKVVFFPLSLKSMRSMKAMQALQPQLNALRSKYQVRSRSGFSASRWRCSGSRASIPWEAACPWSCRSRSSTRST